MRRISGLAGLAAIGLCTAGLAQGGLSLDDAPAIGEELPSVDMYDADGHSFNTSRIRGKHAVIVFGCLT